MNCRQVDEILNTHALDALSDAASRELDSHLEICERCADSVLSYRSLAAETPPDPAPGFYAATRAIAAGRPATGRNSTDRPTTERPGTERPATDRPASDRPGSARPAPVPAPRHLGPSLALAATALIALVLAGLIGFGDDAAGPLPEPGADTAGAGNGVAGGLPTTAGNTPTAFEPEIPGFLAGIHYARLPQLAPTTSADDRIEVCWFFLFPCSHCYDVEAALSDWARTRGDIELVRVPVLFNPVARLQARAFYAAELLGRGDAIIAPFYQEIHERGNPLSTREALREFVGRIGIDGASFDRAFDSAAVDLRLAEAEALNNGYGVAATPAIGVNGRFLTNAGMAGSSERLFEIADALVEAEAEAEPAAAGLACMTDTASPACRVRVQQQLPPPTPRAPF